MRVVVSTFFWNHNDESKHWGNFAFRQDSDNQLRGSITSCSTLSSYQIEQPLFIINSLTARYLQHWAYRHEPNSYKHNIECLPFDKGFNLVYYGYCALQQIYPATITEHKTFACHDAPFSTTPTPFRRLSTRLIFGIACKVTFNYQDRKSVV